jgi:hypothetical protein
VISQACPAEGIPEKDGSGFAAEACTISMVGLTLLELVTNKS